VPRNVEESRRLTGALVAVRREVLRQDELWGTAESQVHQNVDRRFSILAEEVGEVAKEVVERNFSNQREELVQVAAVAISNILRIDAGVEHA
jgi:NTP pyrophosphatase (non-canonical NTP hydrolase)